MHLARHLLLIGLWLWCGLAQAATYTFRSDTYAWESSATALSTFDRTCTSYPGDDDKATITFTGGFKFTFAGTAYTSVRVLTNGGLQFGTDTGFFRTFTNTTLPAGVPAGSSSGCAAATTTNVILAYWTDLNPSQTGSGGITWEQKGTAPNRYVVVTWNGVYQYNTSTPYSFQIILYENGEFKFQYGNSNASGAQATIGVQVDSSDYTQYSYNSGYNANGSAIRWFMPTGTPTRRAEYRFDEYGYSSRTGEVVDSSGNSSNGIRVGTAANTVAGGYVCRGLSVPADTTTASNGVDTLLNVASGLGSAGAVTLWYNANTAWNAAAAMLLDATSSAAKPFFLMRQSDGSLRATVTDSAGTVLTATTAALGYAAGTWRHVAVSWRLAAGSNQSTLRIYVGGQQAGATTGTTNGTLDSSIGNLFVGDNRSTAIATNASANSANGVIDEMRAYNYDISAFEIVTDMNATHVCPSGLDHIEAVPDSTSYSTCTTAPPSPPPVSPMGVTLRACSNPSCTVLLTSYTGTVNLSTSSNWGTWALGTPAPTGLITTASNNAGTASYRFVTSDLGVARLTLSHSLAQSVTLTAVDSGVSTSSSTSAAVRFSDNAFVWTEDLANKVTGTNIVVAGRAHDLQISLIKKDASNGACGVATNFTGSRTLKLWRTDNGGPWTAPSVVSPALSIPAARPASNNLTLTFTSGVASFNLGTTDIGKYNLNVDDDSLTYASATVSGSSGDLTVRPFALVLSGLASAGTGNPGGSTDASTVFAKAGAAFSATVGAYRYNSATGVDDGTGQLATTATLAQATAGGLAPGYSAGFTLPLLASSQTPAAGALGTLSNAAFSTFSGGSSTLTTVAYSEVGSFRVSTVAKVVPTYLGTSGVDLTLRAFNASGTQSDVVGRFIPASFALGGTPTLTHRSDLTCPVASVFTYLGENFQLAFTLQARNASGGTTVNYINGNGTVNGSTVTNQNFAKLPVTAAAFVLTGGDGTTVFKAGSRLNVAGGGQAWANGASTVALTASVDKAAAPSGPFSTAKFGIAPVDTDGVAMAAYDLDVDPASAGNDATLIGQIPLLQGRLRLQNGMSGASRALTLPLTAQSWNGTAFTTNTLDSCTKVSAANLSYGNLRRLNAGDGAMAAGTSVTVNPTQPTFLTLPAPGGGRLGSVDVAISMGTVADNSCMAAAGWVPTAAATAGANLNGLRNAWCGAATQRDPSARATWGLYRGADGVVYQRENY